MSQDEYDGSVVANRKLTEDEIREVRITLLPYFHASAGGLGVEDITDFLDYTFAMISNAKSVDYVVQELVGMEMDFCTPEVAKRVGKELAAFINKVNEGDGTDKGSSNPQDDPSGGAPRGNRVVSLKVSLEQYPFFHSFLSVCSFLVGLFH